MKRTLALLLAASAMLVAGAAAATAAEPPKAKGPFAGAVSVTLELTKADGSTSTVTFERKKGEKTKPDHVFRGVVHADITVTLKDGSTKQLQYDRGAITAIDASSVTLKRRDGKSVTLGLTSSTRVRDEGQDVPVSDLKAGERAMFFSQGGAAFLIRCISGKKS
jgi:hypothetical protein